MKLICCNLTCTVTLKEKKKNTSKKYIIQAEHRSVSMEYISFRDFKQTFFEQVITYFSCCSLKLCYFTLFHKHKCCCLQRLLQGQQRSGWKIKLTNTGWTVILKKLGTIEKESRTFWLYLNCTRQH